MRSYTVFAAGYSGLDFKSYNDYFTIFVLKDTFPKYVVKQTYAAKQLVNEHMYNLKTKVRENYSNYKVCHGSFNAEEARDVLRELLVYKSSGIQIIE